MIKFNIASCTYFISFVCAKKWWYIMAEVLTQKQIDELLGNIQKGGVALDAPETQQSGASEKKEKQYKEYDFLTPKRVNREQIKLLDSIFENFARLFALQLSSMMRVGCEAELVQLDEYQYNEFSNALNDSVLIGSYDILREKSVMSDKQILFEISRPLAYSMIDRLFGGSGATYSTEKEHTEIELAIMEYIYLKTVGVFYSSWSSYMDLKVNYNQIETNSRLIQSVAPDDTVIVAVIEISIRKLKEKVSVCLPLDVLAIMFKAFDTKFSKSSKKSDSPEEIQRKDFIIGSLTESPLTITALLGETDIQLGDLLGLTPGDIISLNTSTKDDSIKVNVDDIPWFSGVMGVKQKKYAIKVGKILDK